MFTLLSMRMFNSKSAYAILWLMSLPCFLLASSKIDTIYYQNGDRVTAEVKYMENNQLKLSTEDAGTFMIEWDKVDSVYILNSMRIMLEGGEILYGLLLPAGVPGSCMVWHRAGDPRLISLDLIVVLRPIEEKFRDRLGGNISSGVNYTKASDVFQMSLNGNITYQAEKNHLELFYDGIVTSEHSTVTQRQNGGTSFKRVLPRKWFLLSLFSLESNSELELDLRTNFTMGGGNSIVHTFRSHFQTFGGLMVNREISKESRQNNIEIVGAMDYAIFIYEEPEVSFHIQGKVIPSMSNFGRIRAEIESDLKWEIFKDFFLKWTFYFSYDSKPLSIGASKSDWAVSLLGIEYKL